MGEFRCAGNCYSRFALTEYLFVNHAEHLDTTVEYQLLSKAVEASKLEMRLNKGQFLPTVALSGGYLYNDFMGPSQNSFYWNGECINTNLLEGPT